MTIHFQDQRGAASLGYRNRAVSNVIICEQKPYPVQCSCRCKVFEVQSWPYFKERILICRARGLDYFYDILLFKIYPGFQRFIKSTEPDLEPGYLKYGHTFSLSPLHPTKPLYQFPNSANNNYVTVTLNKHKGRFL